MKRYHLQKKLYGDKRLNDSGLRKEKKHILLPQSGIGAKKAKLHS
jgi:hypothetical protein